MSRLSRFEAFRFVGARDTMRVYDCDDPSQLDRIESRVETEDMVERDLLQTFAPDTLAEAANRGFRPDRRDT